MNNKFFVLGLMGSGKSHWAQKLSTASNIPSFDLDTEIEKIECKTVKEIFSAKGETYFRQQENEVLKNFEGKENFILSTGGGAPCFFDNMDWMNANGITIWIDEPLDIIAERLQKEKSHRPLIASVNDNDLKNFLAQMRDKRKPFYSKAKHHLTGDEINENNFLKIIHHNE